MQWNLEGMAVSGLYMNSFPVSGRVELSRVMYGGRVSHHIVLKDPITVFGAVRDRVILKHSEIERVSDSL